jgi:pentatricopeptide repeat protein
MVMEHARVHGLVQEGLAFLDAMRVLDIPRKSLTLLPLLKLCASAGRQEEMVRLVEEMKEKDLVAPTAQIYSQAIEAAMRAAFEAVAA